jgi:UMP-CMP kinase
MLGRSAFRCVGSAFASKPPFQRSWMRGGSSQLPASLSITNEQAACDSLDIVGSKLFQRDFGGITYWDTSQLDEFRVCFILGGPGAGKGTQSEFMKNYYPCVHLSAGELLRNVPVDSPHKALVDDCLVAGKIVPVEISLSLLRDAMQQAHGKSLVFLIDGFPRNFDNLQGWVTCMKHVASVWGVLMFTCPLQELEQRILSRAETSGRSDDNIKSAQKRFATFERETMPVVDTLRRVQAKLQKAEKPALHVVDIQGDQSIQDVWRDTQHAMNEFVSNDVLTANAQLLQAVAEGNVDLYSQLYAIPEGMTPVDVMKAQESGIAEISNTQIDFVTGTKVVVSYNRSDGLRETRVWSHEGILGWVNVHFSRTLL